jgi:hypothetical protein
MSRLLNSSTALNDQQSQQNYYFTIAKYPEVSYDIVDAAIPDISLGKMGIKTPYYEYKVTGTSLSFSELRLTFIVNEDLANYLQIYKWLMSLKEFAVLPDSMLDEVAAINEKLSSYSASVKSDCQLHILTNKKNTQTIFKFVDCWPYSLGSINLSVKAGVSTVVCNFSLTFDSFEIVSETI